jgi:hypothetical protein
MIISSRQVVQHKTNQNLLAQAFTGKPGVLHHGKPGPKGFLLSNVRAHIDVANR